MRSANRPIVDFDGAAICRFYVTKKAVNFQDDMPSFPIENFKNDSVLVFDLMSMQDATEKCQFPKLFREPLRLELNFTIPLEQITELIVQGKRKSSFAVHKFGVAGKNIRNGHCFCPTISQMYLSTHVPVLRFIPTNLCFNSTQ